MFLQSITLQVSFPLCLLNIKSRRAKCRPSINEPLGERKDAKFESPDFAISISNREPEHDFELFHARSLSSLDNGWYAQPLMLLVLMLLDLMRLVLVLLVLMLLVLIGK